MSMITEKYWYLITHTLYAATFGEIGKRSLIYKPMQIDGRKSIYIENDVYISQSAWLMGNGTCQETLRIKSGTTVGHYSHIIGMQSVIIENDVLVADKVFISDCSHSYEKKDLPIKKQEIKMLLPVTIGEGSWIGENVCICGASIGKHCVIGANSVVLSSIPDYSVAVGSPAKVIKRYDDKIKQWVKVDTTE